MGYKKNHSAVLTTSRIDLPKAGSALKVAAYNGDGRVGTLQIGQGGIFWTEKNHTYGKRFSWTEFSTLMSGVSS